MCSNKGKVFFASSILHSLTIQKGFLQLSSSYLDQLCQFDSSMFSPCCKADELLTSHLKSCFDSWLNKMKFKVTENHVCVFSARFDAS